MRKRLIKLIPDAVDGIHVIHVADDLGPLLLEDQLFIIGYSNHPLGVVKETPGDAHFVRIDDAAQHRQFSAWRKHSADGNYPS